jgi:hypothetical protein
LVSEFVFPDVGKLEQRLSEQEETGITRTLACPGEPGPSMKTALRSAEQAKSSGIESYFDRACNSFNNYRSEYHGRGPAYRYSRAWSDACGWLSGADSRIVLRIDNPMTAKPCAKTSSVNLTSSVIPRALIITGKWQPSSWRYPDRYQGRNGIDHWWTRC